MIEDNIYGGKTIYQNWEGIGGLWSHFYKDCKQLTASTDSSWLDFAVGGNTIRCHGDINTTGKDRTGTITIFINGEEKDHLVITQGAYARVVKENASIKVSASVNSVNYTDFTGDTLDIDIYVTSVNIELLLSLTQGVTAKDDHYKLTISKKLAGSTYYVQFQGVSTTTGNTIVSDLCKIVQKPAPSESISISQAAGQSTSLAYTGGTVKFKITTNNVSNVTPTLYADKFLNNNDGTWTLTVPSSTMSANYSIQFLGTGAFTGSAVKSNTIQVTKAAQPTQKPTYDIYYGSVATIPDSVISSDKHVVNMPVDVKVYGGKNGMYCAFPTNTVTISDIIDSLSNQSELSAYEENGSANGYKSITVDDVAYTMYYAYTRGLPFDSSQYSTFKLKAK